MDATFFIEPLELEAVSYIRVLPRQYIPELPTFMKKIKGARWTKEYGWFIPYNPDAWAQLKQLFPDAIWEVKGKDRLTAKAVATSPQISAEQRLAVLKMVESLTLKRYSHRTIKVYRNCLTLFFRFMQGKIL